MIALSTVEALKLIRIYRARHPELDNRRIIELIKSVEVGGLDYDAALELDALVPNEADVSCSPTFLRSCLGATIARNAVWISFITLGRQKFVQKLERDEVSCFRCAQLLDVPPSQTCIEWWDRMQGFARSVTDASKMEQAREAEQLSLQIENERLSMFGIDEPPVWMAIEDNSVGYDILSYRPGGSSIPINFLIEVKSFRGRPRFYLTQNEWKTALKFGDNFRFHIWDMDRKLLFERSVEEVRPHIPTNNNEGAWDDAIIQLDRSA